MKPYPIRQGDIAYIPAKMPKGLKKSATNIILQSGSGGNPHSFTGGAFYPHQDSNFVIGYLQAKNTKLFHAEHGPKSGVAIPNGTYEVRRQVEDTHEGLKVVED